MSRTGCSEKKHQRPGPGIDGILPRLLGLWAGLGQRRLSSGASHLRGRAVPTEELAAAAGPGGVRHAQLYHLHVPVRNDIAGILRRMQPRWYQ